MHKSAPSQLRIGLGLTRFAIRATLRNKTGYFFSLVFPLVFVLVFGLLSDTRSVLKIGVSDRLPEGHPVVAALQADPSVSEGEVALQRSADAVLEKQLREGKIAALLVPAAEDSASIGVTTSQNAGQQALTAGALVQVAADRARRGADAERVERRQLPGRQYRHIDYVLPGQIGFSILALATFGIGYNLLTLRKTLVLKRMFATSARPLTFLVAQGLSRTLQGVLQTAILIAVGAGLFHATLAHGWTTAATMTLLSAVGLLSFLGFGIVGANLSDDEHVVSMALNLFHLPQVLVAGVFFPSDALPGWVQAVGNHLPLAYLNTSLRMAALDGAGLAQVAPYLAGLGAWAVLAYWMAARTFRAE
ncbi:MAG: ABC transporter permease [Armatimonadota bacterium]